MASITPTNKEECIKTFSFDSQSHSEDLAHSFGGLRPARFAGSSYPAQAEQLSRLLDNALVSSADGVKTILHHTYSAPDNKQPAHAIVAPHIDFRVGLSCYAPAYQALQASNAEVFVIIATSHYGWGDLFIPSTQHFATPLGTVCTDMELLRELYKRLPMLPCDNRFHRDEHSIEFEVVWLQHLFGGSSQQEARPFTVLPILVTSFHPFIERNVLPAQTDVFARFLEALLEVLALSGKKVAWIASGDMAHVGRKFDHPYDAEPMLELVRSEDEELIDAMEALDAERYYRLIAEVHDHRNICGLSPVYTMLEALRQSSAQSSANTSPQASLRGILLKYEQWHERETRSAVTYSSVGYFPAV
jgi:AmmeMemoRadiSam system protein B